MADFQKSRSFASSLTQKFKKIMSEIESEVKAIIVDKLGVDEKEVTPEANFTNDLGADSLDTVELSSESPFPMIKLKRLPR